MSIDIRQSIGLPPSETVAFFRAKGYLPAEYRENWDGIWQEEHARWFTVTKLFNNQLLEEVRRSLDKVLSEGGTYEDWKKAILPKLSAPGATGVDPRLLTSNARLRIVYDTNLRMARAAGKWKRIQDLKGKAPYLMYDAVNDGRTRPQHRIWGGLDTGRPIILPVDHPAWRIFFPPCGWGCRCGVIQLSERDLKRQGLSVTTDADLIAIGWPTASGVAVVADQRFRRSTGEIVSVPAGVDPGFAYNPGIQHLIGLSPTPLVDEVTVPRILPAGTPPPPLPTPRALPAGEILPVDTAPEEVVRRFMAAFDLAPDGEKIVFDPTGEPVAVTRRMLTGVNGTLKTNIQGRQRYPLLAARTLLEPDEIWHEWVVPDPAKVAKSGKQFPARLRRRYIARYDVEGVEQTIMFAVDLGTDGWEGRTWFQEREAGYMDRTARTGTLFWRRADHMKKGPAQ